MIRSPLLKRQTLSFLMFASMAILSSMQLAHADDEMNALDGWLIPGCSYMNKTDFNATSLQADAALTRQLETVKPFHEVVGFYLDKGNVDRRDNPILLRTLPTTKASSPSFCQQTEGASTTTVLHRIGENVATCHISVTGPKIGTLSVSISKSRKDAKTFIQMIQRPWPAKKAAMEATHP